MTRIRNPISAIIRTYRDNQTTRVGNPDNPYRLAHGKWRVTYPGITQDLIREFDNEGAANRFAQQRRNATGRLALPNDWRHVKVEKA